jgi:hypothetical protein
LLTYYSPNIYESSTLFCVRDSEDEYALNSLRVDVYLGPIYMILSIWLLPKLVKVLEMISMGVLVK